jgi:glycosyltransferase involved in cell wall biosynthesis
LWQTPREAIDAVQVRDLPLTAAALWIAARMRGLPFFFWMSYPVAEGDIDLARARGWRSGLKAWVPWLRGHAGCLVLYRWLLPHCDHVFVQSEQMRRDMVERGVSNERMTPVPMGIDPEQLSGLPAGGADDSRLNGRRVIVYLGTLDRPRRIGMLFEMMCRVRERRPDALLVLAGDTADKAHLRDLQRQVAALGLSSHVLFTGWLPTDQAWRYVKSAEVGLSPFPRSFLLDSCSPTKVVEYLAMCVPVVANPQPDQRALLEASGGGLCVPWSPDDFAQAVLELLDDPEAAKAMAARGRDHVLRERGYPLIADRLAAVYRRLLPAASAVGAGGDGPRRAA